MTTVIIDYGAGNLHSMLNAMRRAAAESGHCGEIVVTSEPEMVAAAERIVLPGVGAFGDCARGVSAIRGLRTALEEAVIGAGRPFLGVCVGMQLLATIGREHGEHAGFGWIPGVVKHVVPDDPALKIPHMGWNVVRFAPHPVLNDLPADHAYFVHSYHFVPEDERHTLGTCDYGGPITAAVGRDSILGVQFHPEKSQALGLALLANFLRWRP